MALLPKTPGVYIEEIPKFPPSIAPVETAIPAFIGYTEKAVRNGEDLTMKPVRIESIAEYEELFGGGPSQMMEIYLDTDNAYAGAARTKGLYLYDNLRMFYANGGGNCYIVSIGNYDATIVKTAFSDGIKKIANEDEPTILVFPDAAALSSNDLYDIQAEALAQCNKLQDRVTVCDLKNSGDFKQDVQDLRNNIGINNLKYGAVYGPWINASLTRFILLRDLTFKRDSGSGAVLRLESLTTDQGIIQILFDISKAQAAVDALRTSETSVVGSGKKWEDRRKEKADVFDASTETTLVALENELQGNFDLVSAILAAVDAMVNSMPTVVTADPNPAASQSKDFLLKKDIEAYIANAGMKSSFGKLAAFYKYYKAIDTDPDAAGAQGAVSLFSDNPEAGTDNNLKKAFLLLKYANAAEFLGVDTGEVAAAFAAASTERAKAELAKNAAVQVCSAAIALYRYTQKSASEYEKKFNEGLLKAFGKYKEFTVKAAEVLNRMPPSGAIAGVYATVDRERGVWKAPANVSLNSVIGPAVKISHEQQGEYNVDANAGKSINIIRSFTGKGTLVWGARTLAGNDNEWRYVSVRRFFNFVEESCKKATEQFVFEPNDANTWVRVQGMIENFLTVLWRQGALQGIKPEHAFYVAVGLGKTMTPLDILEGRMYVEIGMAVVRPAEFIILRFSHKMAES